MVNWLKQICKRILIFSFCFPEYAIKFRKYNALSYVDEGFKDHRSSRPVEVAEAKIVFQRLVESYNKSKSQEGTIDPPYKVGCMWQKILNERFGDLLASVRNSDLETLQRLLENFHREQFTLGAGSGYDDYMAMGKNSLYKYQFVNTWFKYFEAYEEILEGPSELTYPLIGNSVGLHYKGQVIPIEAIRYHYYATEIHSLLRGLKNPVICEIGGGLGGLAYQVVRLAEPANPVTYILFDIPEMLLVSSYFLMLAFPEREIMLYGGEEAFDPGRLGQCDVVLMPNFMLPKLQDQSVDLFLTLVVSQK